MFEETAITKSERPDGLMGADAGRGRARKGGAGEAERDDPGGVRAGADLAGRVVPPEGAAAEEAGKTRRGTTGGATGPAGEAKAEVTVATAGWPTMKGTVLPRRSG